MSVVVQKYVLELGVSTVFIIVYPDGTVTSFNVLVAKPPTILNVTFCDEVLLLVIFNLIVVVFFDVILLLGEL